MISDSNCDLDNRSVKCSISIAYRSLFVFISKTSSFPSLSFKTMLEVLSVNSPQCQGWPMMSVLFPSVMVTSLFVSKLVAEAILAIEPSSNFNLAEAFKSTS